MQKLPKVKRWMMPLSLCILVSCTTLGNYFLPPLKERELRIDSDSARTVYRWYEKYCAKRILGMCISSSYKEHIEHDFDFTKGEDRRKMNDMGFICKVREKPTGNF